MKRDIILLTHGRAAEGLMDSAKMLLGDMSGVYIQELFPGVSMDEYLLKVEAILKEIGDEPLVLVDLFGGTPSNVAYILNENYPMHIISGLNLAMLLEAYMSKEILMGEEYIKAVEEAGRNGCRNVLGEKE